MLGVRAAYTPAQIQEINPASAMKGNERAKEMAAIIAPSGVTEARPPINITETAMLKMLSVMLVPTKHPPDDELTAEISLAPVGAGSACWDG